MDCRTKAVNLSNANFVNSTLRYAESPANRTYRFLALRRGKLAGSNGKMITTSHTHNPYSKNTSAINQFSKLVHARSTASRASHFKSRRRRIGNVGRPSEKINTTSTPVCIIRAGNRNSSKLAQKQQQQMGKVPTAYQVSEDDEDSEDEELLVEDAPRDAPDAPHSKLPKHKALSESFIGNRSSKLQICHVKVQSFKTGLLTLTPSVERNRVS